jgi:hypothetical protein
MENITSIWLNLFRVIEIAKAGNFSLSVYYQKDYVEAEQDYQFIKEFCKGWFENFSENGDLACEIVKPAKYNEKVKGETKETISKRIEKSLKSEKPEIVLDSSSEVLLDTATNRLSLSILDVNKIKEVASVIALVDASKKGIRIEHIAEAIQYNTRAVTAFEENIVNAESKDINFNDIILIKKGIKDKETIQKAIDYLTNLM